MPSWNTELCGVPSFVATAALIAVEDEAPGRNAANVVCRRWVWRATPRVALAPISKARRWRAREISRGKSAARERGQSHYEAIGY